MKLEFNRNPILKTFDELEVGQTYYHSNGNLNIKTSQAYDGNNCIYYDTLHKRWSTYYTAKNTVVEVVESTLSIDSYEREIKR